MRIAHIDTGREWRGGQAQVLLLLRGLLDQGHAVVLAAPDAPLAERAREAGVAWIPVRTGGDFDFGAGARLARGLSPWRPELLHAHTARAHTLARAAGPMLGAPVVVSRRVLAPIGRNPFSRRKYLRGVARYLCISRSVMDVLARGGAEAARLALVPSAVDLGALGEVRERVSRGEFGASLRELAGAPANAMLVGAVGALTREKGIDTFVSAAAATLAVHPDTWWVWIGDGPERSRLERACARRGIAQRVRVLGFRRDAHDLVAQLTLFVSTSLHEGLGGAVLEAQALGVPVIATDSGGVRDSVEDGVNGRIVTGAAGLGAAITVAVGDPATVVRWRDAALESVQRFSPARMLERTLAEYAKVLSEGAAGGAD